MQSYGSKWLDASLLADPVDRISADRRSAHSRHDRSGRAAPDAGRLHHAPRSRARSNRARAWRGRFPRLLFWLADCYVLLGRKDEARKLFERLLAIRNDLGLLAEEYDVGKERQVGNFPQAFSHIALVTTAHNLSSPDKPAEQRGDGKGRQCRAAGVECSLRDVRAEVGLPNAAVIECSSQSRAPVLAEAADRPAGMDVA